MSNITLLDQNTINKIAAGEVIERPAAVVKELIENAIDAGANAITAEIKEGGISFIRITDNGSGIAREEVTTAFLRHATSKIKSVEDLLSVSSLGFRGEALSSIASVAQVELVTKTEHGLTGTRYVIEGGAEKTSEDIGCPGGTTFIVRNLFYNTPARRKFLKSPTTEAGYISDLVERLAVSHPGISFKFINNNQIKLHTSGNNNLKDIIYNIYGREICSNVVQINEKSDHITIEGYIGKPVISRGNRNYENYYINGRFIKSSILNKAIDEAYKSFIMSHRYPFTALHFTIDSEYLDVNVHPTKMEVRFKNSEEIYTATYHAIKDALSGRELIPDVELVREKEQAKKYGTIPEPFETNRKRNSAYPLHTSDGHAVLHDSTFVDKNTSANSTVDPTVMTNVDHRDLSRDKNWVEAKGRYTKILTEADRITLENEGAPTNLSSGETKELVQNTEIGKLDYVIKHGEGVSVDTISNSPSEQIASSEQINLFEDKLLSKQAKKNHRIIGQVFSTYWIIEYGDKMFIIDQHAAHEKVLYEKAMAAVAEKEYLSQMIQPPIILTLSMIEENILKKNMDSLNSLGFEIEHFGGKEYSVRAVPADMLGIAQKELLIELIDSLAEEGGKDTPELVLEKVASMSCKAAVKGNNKLSYEEASALIEQLLELENPYHCPHGRPTIISMSKYEIEKKFKRIL